METITSVFNQISLISPIIPITYSFISVSISYLISNCKYSNVRMMQTPLHHYTLICRYPITLTRHIPRVEQQQNSRFQDKVTILSLELILLLAGHCRRFVEITTHFIHYCCCSPDYVQFGSYKGVVSTLPLAKSAVISNFPYR